MLPKANTSVITDVTFGVSTSAKLLDSLLMTLTSVLMGKVLPGGILVRFEGPLPNIGSFYLEQLSCLAQTMNVRWDMVVDKSQGVRHARNWLVQNCMTQWLWMGDDDAVYHYDCLEEFSRYILNRNPMMRFVGLAGVKIDVTNRRGYPDWSNDELNDFNPSMGPCCLNHYYSRMAEEKLSHLIMQPLECLDTGNCVIDTVKFKDSGLTFQIFPDSEPNAGGEDTLLAMLAAKKEVPFYPCIMARAAHLEKSKILFNDISARAELLKRSRQLL